jgi:hypothetical protein
MSFRSRLSVKTLHKHLPNVRSVRLTNTCWDTLTMQPSHIKQFLFGLKLQDIQLDHVEFALKDAASDFSATLSGIPTLKQLTLYDVQFDDGPAVVEAFPAFGHPLSFGSLDTHSIVWLANVLEPLIEKKHPFSVHSLHLRLPVLCSRDVQEFSPYLSAALHHIGPSVQRLFVELSLLSLPLFVTDSSKCIKFVVSFSADALYRCPGNIQRF